MRIFSFLDRHNWYATRADAYADRELEPSELRRFEAHLAGCDRCLGVVADAAVLRASVEALPEVEVPRSFRLTPQMAGQAASPRARKAGTPIYLGFARVGAALSVAAFAGVLVVNTLQTSNQSSNDSAAAQMADGEASLSGDFATDSAATEKAAEPEATAALAPAISGGGVSGSSVATPTQVSSRPILPPTSELVTPSENSGDVTRSSADTGDDALSSIGYEAGAAAEDDKGVSPWTVALGIAAGSSLLLLAGLEVSRRVRRA